jgi:hypothetical protein
MLMMVLAHLPTIKLWTLITFAYGIAIRHHLVRSNPFQLLTRDIWNFKNNVIKW